MKHTIREQCLALAGLFQSVKLVQQVANGDPTDESAIKVLVNSIFTIDADSVMAVYGETAGLNMGLHGILKYLSNKPGAKDLEVIRYVINIMDLERKLIRRKDLLDALGSGIIGIRPGGNNESETNEDRLTRLATLYQQTISTLKPRIMVKGEPRILAEPAATIRIRVLLLAGIRSAVLWRQSGGNKLSLLLRRRRLLQEADLLLR